VLPADLLQQLTGLLLLLAAAVAVAAAATAAAVKTMHESMHYCRGIARWHLSGLSLRPACNYRWRCL